MGVVQLGCMALSTLFTLVLVPTVFSLWVDAESALLALRGRKHQRGEAPGELAPGVPQAAEPAEGHRPPEPVAAAVSDGPLHRDRD